MTSVFSYHIYNIDSHEYVYFVVLLPFQVVPLGYVWFPENLRENARERKCKGKVEGKKK